MNYLEESEDIFEIAKKNGWGVYVGPGINSQVLSMREPTLTIYEVYHFPDYAIITVPRCCLDLSGVIKQ